MADRRPVQPATGEEAFASLVREHGGTVYALVLRRVGDRGIAEDLAQETFLRAWRARASLRDPGAARGWLCAIAANVARDHLRRANARPRESRGEPIPEGSTAVDDPAARVESADDIRRFAAALERLPENHREMFLLREREGLSYREIADVLGCPIGSVMSGLARARERLLAAMEM